MARKRQGPKLDSGPALSKGRLKRLRQEDETWEADFRAVPKPLVQSQAHYIGIVAAKREGTVIARTHIERKPTANDLAALLAQAMRKPLTGVSHRPRRLHLRGHRQWRELFPHLEELGIDVAVRQELPTVKRAYEDNLGKMREARRATMVKPSKEQAAVEKLFPAIAKWVQGSGPIEIGDQEMVGFVVRALDYGGVVFEDDRPETLAEAMAALDKGLAQWLEENG